MNEISIHGNVTAALELSYGRTGDGKAFAILAVAAVAVNRGYFDRQRNARVQQPTVSH